jgi:hypothetical protein
MYARDFSTRSIEAALAEATGDRLLSRTAVRWAIEVLRADSEAFTEPDMPGFEVEYLFPDTVHESLPKQARLKEGMLIA